MINKILFKLVVTFLLVFGIYGCTKGDEANKLGFSTVKEMSIIQSKGWHTKYQYDSDMAMLNEIAQEKKRREAAIASNQIIAKKIANEIAYNQALSAGMPLRAINPISPLIIKTVPTSLAWLEKLPFGAPSAFFNERFKSFCHRGSACELPEVQTDNGPCFSGFLVKCITVKLSFSDSDQLYSISAKYENSSDLNFDSFISDFSSSFDIGEQSDKETHFQGSTMRRKIISWVLENGSVKLEQKSGPGFGINDYGNLIFNGTTSVVHTITITSK